MFRKAKNMAAGAILVAAPLFTLLAPGIAHALPSAYCEWTGTFSTAWDDEANWTSVNSGCSGTSVNNSGSAQADPNTVPGTGDNLVFGNVAASNQPSNNNLTGLSVGSLDFEAVAAGQALGGNAFTLTGNITNNTGSSDNIGNNVTISATSVMDMGNMAVVNFTGVLSGSGNITKQGVGDVDFVGGFTNTGAVTVSAGILGINAASSADFTGSSVTVASGATFAYNAFGYASPAATYTFSKPITSAGTLDFQTATGTFDLNLTGTITLTGDTTIVTSSGETVHVQGPLHGTGFTLIASGSGVVLNESTDNTTDTPDGDITAGASGTDDGGLDAPDTGFAMASAHPGVTLAITVTSAGAIFVVARMTRKSASRRNIQR